MTRRFQCSIFLLIITVVASTAQTFKVREATKEEIPLEVRHEYEKSAGNFVNNYYYQLLNSVGSEDDRQVIIEDIMADEDNASFKTEFSQSIANILPSTPAQYLIKFMQEYGNIADDINFTIDNVVHGKMMMTSQISCYIPVEYDLTCEYSEKLLFKRRCRLYAFFPKAITHRRVKAMQVEPIRDIIPYNASVFASTTTADDNTYSYSMEEEYQQAAQWYKQGLKEKYLPVFKKLAEQGDAKSQNYLGLCYDNEKDYNKAAYWYEKAAEQGYVYAQYNLGVCYYNGTGKEKDYNKAAYWYEKAAEQGYADAQNNLGNSYYYGEGKEKDYNKAAYWYEKAAEQGYVYAQYYLGNSYYLGEGKEKDYNKAAYWYEKAAEQGLAKAQLHLGYSYYYGQGKEKDYNKAAYWYEKAAEQGLAKAQLHLGYSYYYGQGKEKDYNKAAYWYEKAAEQGNALAQTMLGVLKEKQKKPTEQGFVVRGRVISGKDNEPLIGASISLESTHYGTATNINGEYSIEIKDAKEATLVFSYVGCSSRKYKVNASTKTLNVTMMPNK